MDDMLSRIAMLEFHWFADISTPSSEFNVTRSGRRPDDRMMLREGRAAAHEISLVKDALS